MQKIKVLEQEFTLTDKDAKLYFGILDAIGIKYIHIQAIPELRDAPLDLPNRTLSNRTYMIIRRILEERHMDIYSTTAVEFVTAIPKKELYRCQNVGSKTLREVADFMLNTFGIIY